MPIQPTTGHWCRIQKWGITLLCLCALPAAAADAPQPGQEALRLQQQQQRDLQQLQLEQRQRQMQRGRFGTPPSTPTAPKDIAQDERCWPLRGTRLAGVTLFSRTELDNHIEPYVAPCMGVTQINRLLAEITRLYVEAGYIASRPYLISAPSAGHPLDIHVEEGYLEAIELADQSLPVSLGAAFPGMLGKPLNLRDLEQGLTNSTACARSTSPPISPLAARRAARASSCARAAVRRAGPWGLGWITSAAPAPGVIAMPSA